MSSTAPTAPASPSARGLLPPLLGLLASALVAAGSTAAHWTAPFFLGHAFWASLHGLGPDVGRVMLLAGVVLLSIAFVLARPRSGRGTTGALGSRLGAQVHSLWGTAALWYLPLLVVPPVLSRDMYAYVDQGWLAGNADPYAVGMGTRGPFAWLVDDFWRGTTSVYPPLALTLLRGVVALGGGDPLATVLLMRVPVIVGLAVVGLLLPRLVRLVPGTLGDVDRAAWLALLNPVTVVHLVGGGHLDAVMVALVVAACVLGTTRGGYLTGSLVAGVAMAVKQPGLLAAVVVALVALPASTWLRRALHAVGAVVIALASFGVVSLATGLGFGWLGGDGAPTKAQTQSPACLVSLLLQPLAGGPWEGVYAVALVVSTVALAVALAASWLACWRSPLLVGGLAFVALAALGPGLQPWYLAPALVLLGAVPVRRWGAVALTSWGAQVVVAQLLQEAWRMPTLLATAWSLPAAAVVGLATARLVGSPARASHAPG